MLRYSVIFVFARQEFCKQKFIHDGNYSDSEFNHSSTEKIKRDAAIPKTRCRLALVADWRFHRNIGNNDEKRTTLNMVR